VLGRRSSAMREATRARKRRGPGSCRTCGKALVTPGERTIGRCRSCPATFDESFFEALREWRRTQASSQGVPAYVVFTDATLIAIAEQLPGDVESLSAIPGVGPAKLEAYGATVMDMVAASVEATRVVNEDPSAT
jgi:DNA helicase-2/ATP-dependent DNA helicase PcrA